VRFNYCYDIFLFIPFKSLLEVSDFSLFDNILTIFNYFSSLFARTGFYAALIDSIRLFLPFLPGVQNPFTSSHISRMAIPLSQEKSRYTALDAHDSLDLEDNDSDATLASTGFLPKRSRRDVSLSAEISNMQTVLVWFRWGTVIALQTVILFFLLWKGTEAPVRDESNWTPAMTETGGDVNGLYIPCLSPFYNHDQDVKC